MSINLNEVIINNSPWLSGGINLNEVETFDYDEFWQRVKQYAHHWVPMLYPAGKISPDKREWRVGNAYGQAPRKQGSFAIQLFGNSAGSGFEYDGAKRYNAVEMVEAVYPSVQGNKAYAWLSGLIGMRCPWEEGDAHAAPRAALPAPAAITPPAAPDPDRYAGDIKLLMSKCVPARGTLVEEYFRGRGLELPDTPDILFCSDIADVAEKMGKPGMVSVVRTPDGKAMAGVHRTFIAADGSKTKKMIGHVSGGAVRLAEMGAEGVLGISEGIETGTAAMWLYGVPTWATLSTSGMIKLDISKIAGLKKLYVFADKGEAGANAANSVYSAAQLLGIPCEIVYPAGEDDFATDVKHGRKPETLAEPVKLTPLVGEILPSFDVIESQCKRMNYGTAQDERDSMLRSIALGRFSPAQEGTLGRALKQSCGITTAEFRQELSYHRKMAKSGPDNGHVPPEARAMAERYIHLKELNFFFDTKTGKYIKKQAILDAHAREMPVNEYGEVEDPDKYLTKTPGLGLSCDGITFIPRGARLVVQDGATNLNTWVDPCMEALPGDVTPWLDHINYLMDGDEVAFKHMCWYFAHIISTPEVKISHAPLIVSSSEGIGKTTLGRMLRHMVGKKNCTLIENSDLSSDFNEWVDGKQLIIVNELKTEGSIEIRNRMAQYITDDMLRINRKGMSTYDYENRMNFLFFSNYTDAAVLRKNDRRFFVWISNAQPKPEAYYEYLNHWFFDQGGCNAVLDWAQKYDLSQHRAHVRPPMTKAKEEVIEASRSNIEQRMQEMFDAQEHPFICDVVKLGDVAEYLETERRMGKVSNKKVQEFIVSVGGANLGRQCRIGGGTMRLWAIRNADRWLNATDKEIEAVWFKPGDTPRGGYGGVLA